MKQTLTLLCAAWLCVAALHAQEGGDTHHVVECGSWVELSATPKEDYHFTHWSDGNTEAIRQVQVNEDMHYVAFFAADCEEYANWPLEQYYDWLLMLNVRKVNAMGYFVAQDRVTWYRVVGEPDDMHNAFPQDDQVVGTGYYLTIDRNLQGTGDYYCVVDASNNQGQLCDGLMRSEIAHYSGTTGGKTSPLLLAPSYVGRGGTVELKGLFPMEESHIYLYDATGKCLATYQSINEETFSLTASFAPGCYLIRVHSNSADEVLRLVIAH